jgi:hypothetical protein
MSSSSSSSASAIVNKMIRKGLNKIKNKKSHKSGLKGPNFLGNTVSYKTDAIVRTFNQTTCANRTNINCSTGATTFGNPTSSVSYVACTSGNITSDSMFAMFFTLADVPQASTFTALFDAYRINDITVIFTPTQAPSTALTSSANMLNVPDPTFWYAVDVDDAGVVAPLTALMEIEAVKAVPYTGKPFRIKFKPHIAEAAYASGVFTSFSNSKETWIDCASSAVQHYGLKFGFGCPINTTWGLPTYSVIVNYNISFRGVR